MNEQVIVEIVLDDGSIQRSFGTITRAGTQAGNRVGRGLEDGIRGGLGRALSDFRRQLAVAAGAFVGITAIRSTLGDLAELETRFAEITTILPNVADANDELRASFLRNAGLFGGSAADQASSFYAIVSAGITDATIAQETLTVANRLAIGGLTDTNSAIRIITGTVNAFGQENITAAEASDVLFGTVRLGQTTVEELSGSLGRVLSPARALGLAFEDVGGAVAALTTRGIGTAQAVTGLNAIFTSVLSGQMRAAMISAEVADAFSLQSLQTRGLSGFLSNLVDSLGGSSTALQMLLGSSQATNAVLALSGDNFESLSSNIRDLGDAAGSTEAAFDVINNTTAQQASRIVPLITGIFDMLTSGTQGAFFDLASGIANTLQFTLDNFRTVSAQIGAILRSLVSFFIALRVGPAVFQAITASTLGAGRAFTALGPILTAARINFAAVTSSIRAGNFSLVGVGAAARSYVAGIRLANIAANVFRATVRLTGLALTFGLSFAIEAVIRAFESLTSSFGGTGNLISFITLTIRRSFNELILGATNFVDSLSNIPIIGAGIRAAIGSTFDDLRTSSLSAIDDIDEAFDGLASRVAMSGGIGSVSVDDMNPATERRAELMRMMREEEERLAREEMARREREAALAREMAASMSGAGDPSGAPGAAAATGVAGAVAETTQAVSENFNQQVNLAQNAWNAIANAVGIGGEMVIASQEQVERSVMASLNNIAQSGLEGLARSFAVVGEALVNNENAFAAWGNAFLGIIGDIAIQYGSVMALASIWPFNPAGLAGGIALIALGGALRALSGGGTGANPAVGTGAVGDGGLNSNPIDGNLSPINGATQNGGQVGITIMGDVFDSEETGMRITDILREQGFQNAVVA